MKSETKKKQPTLSDVAAAVGVTPMTVSRVVNQNGYVSESTKEKVLQAIKETNYRSNGLARNLKRQRTDAIGLVLGDISNPFATELARAVRQTTSARNYNLFVCISEHNADEDIAAFEALANHGVDGIIVATRANDAGNERLKSLADNGIPMVVINRDFEHETVDSVIADNMRGGFEATQHLIDLGHERIGFIGATLHGKNNLKRLQGYLSALEQHNLAIDERLVTGRRETALDAPGYSTEEIGYAAMKRLMSLKNRPTAIFARNDFTAIGAMSAAKDLGLSIPHDVAIVGFDDIPLAVHTSPPLTTVRQPTRLYGQMAAEWLVQRIEAEETISRHERIFECELIIRESTILLKK